MIKKTTLMFVGWTVSQAEYDFGKSIGAQFRNYQLIDEDDAAEPHDLVCGNVIPLPYEDSKVHPEWPEDGIEAGSDASPSADANGRRQKPSQEAPEDESKGIPDELDLDALTALSRKQLVQVATEEELTFKENATKAVLFDLVKTHFGL